MRLFFLSTDSRMPSSSRGVPPQSPCPQSLAHDSVRDRFVGTVWTLSRYVTERYHAGARYAKPVADSSPLRGPGEPLQTVETRLSRFGTRGGHLPVAAGAAGSGTAAGCGGRPASACDW